ncbi:hypothetical protein [Desulfurispora thermophila]|uniref:hypothetical protein n=1 Tax=Desulfurispora thermophila TaxID=265470 RepID=UPI000361D3D1|nr:hypothetical protein [Desulfurispora thermophila]
MQSGKWLILLIVFVACFLVAFDLLRMVTVEHDIQTALNNAAAGAMVKSLDPAPLRVGSYPRINPAQLQTYLPDLMRSNFKMKAMRVATRVYKVKCNPPAIAVSAKATIDSLALKYFYYRQPDADVNKEMKGRAVVIYESKSTN